MIPSWELGKTDQKTSTPWALHTVSPNPSQFSSIPSPLLRPSAIVVNDHDAPSWCRRVALGIRCSVERTSAESPKMNGYGNLTYK